ncbi:hypothetical protein DIPPA_09816 [Diplonema papillatum]|nr:hypothetical protein DIPPA_09816 [Diplonema papillatum]
MVRLKPADRETVQQLLGHPLFDGFTPREVRVAKAAEDSLRLTLVDGPQGAVLAEVAATPAAAASGLPQFVGYCLTHVNGVPLGSLTDRAVVQGVGYAEIVYWFGKLADNPLANSDVWQTHSAPPDVLRKMIHDDIRTLQRGS